MESGLPDSLFTIIAPHPDDELIGCSRLIMERKIRAVIYLDAFDPRREREAREVCARFDMQAVVYNVNKEQALLIRELTRMEVDRVYLVPSPMDGHWLHSLAYSVVSACYPYVGIYSTRMRDPFVQDSADPHVKKQALDKWYPSQASLWANDHRYWLFEGVSLRL